MRLTSILPIDRVTYSDAFFSCQQTALIRASSSMPHANCVIAMYVVTYRSYRKMSLRYLSIHEKKRSTTPRLAWVRRLFVVLLFVFEICDHGSHVRGRCDG